MKNYNLTIIEGNLVKDPVVSKSQKGNTVLKFAVASNGYGTPTGKKWQGHEEVVSYFDIIAWAELAEKNIEKLKKGIKVKIVGHLSQWRWKDESGKHHSKIHISAEYIDIPLNKSDNKKKHFF